MDALDRQAERLADLLVRQPAEIMEDDDLARGLLQELQGVLDLEPEARRSGSSAYSGSSGNGSWADPVRVQTRGRPPTDRPQPLREPAGVPKGGRGCGKRSRTPPEPRLPPGGESDSRPRAIPTAMR